MPPLPLKEAEIRDRGAVPGLLWLAQRLSGVLLAGGLALHLGAIHLLPGSGLSFRDVAARLASPGWRLFEAAFLVVVTYHALAGLWIIVEDYVPGPRLRRLLLPLLLALGAGLTLSGLYSLAAVAWAN